jgi:hypothetical protein
VASGVENAHKVIARVRVPGLKKVEGVNPVHIHAYVVQHAISIGVDRIKCQTICVIYNPKRSGVNSMTGGNEINWHINSVASDCWQCFRNLQHWSGLSKGGPEAAALSCPDYRQALSG